MKGIITRLSLKQFMVFTDIEMKPGRHVNLIIAPNGCGKSSLIAGIMLVLCGKPHDIGRGSNLGTFVKTGFSDATIEIELLNPDDEDFSITRHIFRENNSSKWLLNGCKATQKQIEELTGKLYIQVDNLCQVLPQDRVYEFSRMNPQTLLENTEKSVGPEILLKYHNELKELSRNVVELCKKQDDISTRIERAISLNRGLEDKVNSMIKRKKYENEIKVLKQQRAWIMYREQYNLVQELKASLSQIKEKIKFHSYNEAEIKAVMNQLKATSTSLTKIQQKKMEEKQRYEQEIRSLLVEVDHQQDIWEKIEEKFEEAKVNEELRVKELEQLRQHLSKLECDLANYNNISEDEIKKRMNEIGGKITSFNLLITNTCHDLEIIQDQIGNIKHHLRAEENKKKRFEDQSNQRLETLKRFLPDVYEAVIWLRANADQFKQKIYEPMMLEMDIKDDTYIPYLEEAIPKRDLQAFICESTEDMNKFINIIREEKNLTVNVLYSGPEHKPSSSYHPKVNIEKLMQYGFNMFVKDMFTAPETIMKYLCRTVGVHQIPVGTAKVDVLFESVPSLVPYFFSATNKYFVRISRYSREKCVSVNSIGHAQLLSSSVDKAEVNRVIESIKTLEKQKCGLEHQMLQLQNKRRDQEKEVGELKDEKRKLQASIGGKEVTERRIKAKHDQIARVEEEQTDIAHERQKADSKKNDVVTNLCAIDKKMKNLVSKLDSVYLECEEIKWKMSKIKCEQKQRQAEERNMAQISADLDEAERKCELEYTKARNEAKEIHTEALTYSDGHKPLDNYYSGITRSREQLSQKIQELQAKADFMIEGDKKVIEEFEQRKENIEELTEELTVLNEKISSIRRKMLEIRNQWLPQLQELIEKISTNFGKCFAKLGCAGEVVLSSEDPDDYERYGINIRVKFRDGDKLQDLNQYTQSGGERSVATALYMIAMQELTHVPFRCVDEINQGMDPENERKVFELLAHATEGGESTPQYFLLTPKLLPGLTYSPRMSVTCILNGTIQKMDCWNLDKQMESYSHKKARKIE